MRAAAIAAARAADTTPRLTPTDNDRLYAGMVFDAVRKESRGDRDRLITYAYSTFSLHDAEYERQMQAEGVVVSAQAIKQCIQEMLVRH